MHAQCYRCDTRAGHCESVDYLAHSIEARLNVYLRADALDAAIQWQRLSVGTECSQ